MTTRDRDPPDDGERLLDALVDAADRTAEHDVLDHAPPSFAAIVARAHRLDPAAVSADDVEHASGVHRAVSRAAIAGVPADDRDELASFVAAARAEAEDEIDAWAKAGLPPLRRPAPPRVRRTVAVLGALAIAAGLVLAIGWLQSYSAAIEQRSVDADQALNGVDSSAERHELTHLDEAEPEKLAPRRRARDREDGPAPAPESAFVVPEDAAPLEQPAPVVAPSAPADAVPAAASPRVRRSPAGVVPKLADRAHGALASGDLDGADRLYRQVIERGGRGALVELAYADRFTIARRRGDVDERRALWAEYLRKFPGGRFADDARAGLCRLAASSDKSECWQDYVNDFPAGAYRSHAERWLPRAGGDPESSP